MVEGSGWRLCIPGSIPVGAIFSLSVCLELEPAGCPEHWSSGHLVLEERAESSPPLPAPGSLTGDRIAHVCASARLGERFVAPGRCLQLGPLPALSCGRLATWSRKNRGRRPGFFSRRRRGGGSTRSRAPCERASRAASSGARSPTCPLTPCQRRASFFGDTMAYHTDRTKR